MAGTVILPRNNKTGVLFCCGRAEIRPVQPDPGNAGEGMSSPEQGASADTAGALCIFRGLSEMMTIQLNGVSREVPAGTTVSDILRDMGAERSRVAVLVNDEIVPAATRDTHELHAGDRVEIIGFAAGG